MTVQLRLGRFALVVIVLTSGCSIIATKSVDARPAVIGRHDLADDGAIHRTQETTYGDWTYYREIGPGSIQTCGFETYPEAHLRKFAFTVAIGGKLKRAITTLAWVNSSWNMPAQSDVPIRVGSERKTFSALVTVAGGRAIIVLNPFSDDFGAEVVAEFLMPGNVMVTRNDDPWTLLSQTGRAEAVSAFMQCFQDRSRGL